MYSDGDLSWTYRNSCYFTFFLWRDFVAVQTSIVQSIWRDICVWNHFVSVVGITGRSLTELMSGCHQQVQRGSLMAQLSTLAWRQGTKTENSIACVFNLYSNFSNRLRKYERYSVNEYLSNIQVSHSRCFRKYGI